jgi:hypothetical protein
MNRLLDGFEASSRYADSGKEQNMATDVKNAFGKLIDEFARETGLGLEIDDKDSCSVITGETVVTMQYRSETDDVALFSAVTAPEDDMSAAVMRKALELACHGKGTHGNFLGLFGDAIVVSRFMPVEGLTAEALGATLLAFADVAAEIADALAAARQNGASEAAGDEGFVSNLGAIPV